MRSVVRLLPAAALAGTVALVSGQTEVPPPWAYGYTAAGSEPAAPPCPVDAKPLDCARMQTRRPDDARLSLPGSEGRFTEYQIHYDYGPADWYPGDHPPMPDLVAHGREADKLRACALCHYPNGLGKPENGPAGGLPQAYILEQLDAFRNGTRRSADPRKANTNEMIQIARHLTADDMQTVARYFSANKWRPWITVVEATTVPKTRPGVNGLFMALPGHETEPLGNRILEVPENPEFTERMRSPRSGFIAYVPPGSVATGEVLVTKGGGKTVQCGICHGADLQGMANVPGIADRPVSYLVRQLFDMKQGARQSTLMKPVVANLTDDDMIAIGAYLGSR
jgi:cytochrome c553